ncbi:MAG: hypothetical protein JOZ62_00880 [Acidobacteriaceae bacterium]|nr:hypothetical protein [Acidobacteriaceae bacterium]
MSSLGRWTVFWLLAAGFMPGRTLAQDQPQPQKTNFSGRWRMVKDKSDFARATIPDMIVRVIDQRGVTMNVHTIQTVGKKTATADVSYLLDGTESQNILNGHDAVSKTFWDGPALMVRTTVKLPNNTEEVVTDRWELSEDGEMLTTTSHIVTAKGGIDLKLVCAKEKLPS